MTCDIKLVNSEQLCARNADLLEAVESDLSFGRTLRHKKINRSIMRLEEEKVSSSSNVYQSLLPACSSDGNLMSLPLLFDVLHRKRN